MITAHAEYGSISEVVIKRPRDGFLDQKTVQKQWEKLNFLSEPDFETSTLEFEFIEDVLANEGTQFHYLPEDTRTTLDSIYCRDASIATDYGMVLCNMGKGTRSHEPGAQQNLYTKKNIPVLGAITSPGTLEGGDCAWVDQETLVVGRTYRSNYAGIDQLKSLLEPKGIQILTAEMPHYQGPTDVFHLMSVFSPIGPKKAVVYSPLMPISLREELLDRNFELIEVPDEEFDSMGCNVLAISSSKCLMVEGNPITRKRISSSGLETTTYAGKEISLKGMGGPTCLTRPLKREI